MKFDLFIQSIDMGHCPDQIQRQALFDLVLFLIVSDGVISEHETDFMQNWLDSIEWSADVCKEEYYTSTLLKCYAAIKTHTVSDFLLHRAKLLVDFHMKQQAMTLVRSVAIADGELDEAEQQVINLLSDVLED
ncbi:TerB family tellurite resistance protein [uncultured Paraglaciecola sp.]|uniref:tellurite resistance TerB family protein n=1 Tax=uncultured Paraglaciecola sp. TaxID=1765024 RepID=UPI0026196508|nr:TerB family tellurite resistance protein [uncultured Paraglaciecola sp.]